MTLDKRKRGCTLAGWPFGLGKELGQSSSLTWPCSIWVVGVKGWKLVVGVNEEQGGVDSNSLWRSLILCRSSFKYSIASPRIEALSIYYHKKCKWINRVIILYILSFFRVVLLFILFQKNCFYEFTTYENDSLCFFESEFWNQAFRYEDKNDFTINWDLYERDFYWTLDALYGRHILSGLEIYIFLFSTEWSSKSNLS